MNKALEVYLSGNTKELDAALAKADKSLKGFGAKMESIGKTMSVAFTAPLVAMGAASIKFASDFNESMNKVDVAFKGSSKVVKDFAKTSLDSFGIAEGTALDMAALFGDMSTSMGLSAKEAAKLSTSLVGLAGDLASFKNMNIGEVTTALNGIFTGETESLKRLGTVMTEDNLKVFALEKGFKNHYETMSQGEKVMLRYQYVLETQKNAIGDFARTQDGAANQMRKFQQGIQELGASFGQVLLPLFTSIVSKLNDVVKGFQGLDKGTKTTIAIIGGLTALAGPLLYLAGTVLPKVAVGFNMIKTAVAGLGISLKTAGLLGVFITMTGFAINAAYDYTKALEGVKGLSDEEKKDTNAIREKNKELYKSISALEKQKALAPSAGTTTGFNTQASKESIQAMIDSQKQQIISNRELLKSVKEVNVEEEKGGVIKKTLTEEELNDAEKFYQAQFKNKMLNMQASEEQRQALYEKINLLKQAAAEATKYVSIFSTAVSNKPKEQITIDPKLAEKVMKDYSGGEITAGIKSTTQVMEESIKATTDSMTLMMIQGKAEIDGWNTKVDEMQQTTASAFESIGMSIMNSLGLGNSALGAFVAQIGGALIKMGALAIAEKIFAGQKVRNEQAQATATGIKIGTNAAAAAGPAGLLLLAPAIASAMGIISASFATVPAFAAGGIVSGPTMALTGEYPGAKSNPEVIAPLDKLQSMIGDTGGNNMNVTGEFVVRGQDLVLALNRATKNYNRLT